MGNETYIDMTPDEENDLRKLGSLAAQAECKFKDATANGDSQKIAAAQLQFTQAALNFAKCNLKLYKGKVVCGTEVDEELENGDSLSETTDQITDGLKDGDSYASDSVRKAIQESYDKTIILVKHVDLKYRVYPIHREPEMRSRS